MTRSLLTLTTDFGASDHFVGVMKGVILSIAPAARIVDITHEIAPFEISEAAYTVAQTYPYFPRGTVHMVVVDPGVGTARRPILVEAAGQRFVGPDNGVFAILYAREKHRVREISNPKLFLGSVSATFHGRDIFAPVAAHLIKGVRSAQVGRLIDDYARPAAPLDHPVRTGKHMWTGTVLKVDRFGNLVTNFDLASFPDLRSRPFSMQVGARQVGRLVETYAQAPFGEPVLIVGSGGYLEVSVNQGSAARSLGIGSGAPVELTGY